MSVFFKGAVIGFSIAMAVGPISLLCIRNALLRGFLPGFATGLGAACADGVYGAIAGFGITAISSVLLSGRSILQVMGGLFLCYLGVQMMYKKGIADKEVNAPARLLTIFTTTFFLTMANPMTIISFIAIYAGLGVGESNNTMVAAGLLTAGIFFGSALWYLLLSGAIALLKNKATESVTVVLNRVSGSIILGFGVSSCASACM